MLQIDPRTALKTSDVQNPSVSVTWLDAPVLNNLPLTHLSIEKLRLLLGVLTSQRRRGCS